MLLGSSASQVDNFKRQLALGNLNRARSRPNFEGRRINLIFLKIYNYQDTIVYQTMHFAKHARVGLFHERRARGGFRIEGVTSL
jgi:hypothetical protein